MVVGWMSITGFSNLILALEFFKIFRQLKKVISVYEK